MPALRSLLGVAGRFDRRSAIARPAAHADRYRPRAARNVHSARRLHPRPWFRPWTPPSHDAYPCGYLAAAAALCRKHGTLFVADEVQTGLGRTGRFLAVEHYGVDPDLVLLAKALSGGFVPVGAVAGKRWIFDRTFNRMDRAVVHGSTFGKNDLAMAAGLATLAVLQEEGLVERAARRGETLLRRLRELVPRYEMLKEVRGSGLMVALEFGPPQSLGLRTIWSLLEKATKGLFCQMVAIPLLTRHRILSQVAGHDMCVIKLLPPLCISDEDEDWIVRAFDDVIADWHKMPSAVWDLATTLAGGALRPTAGI